MRRLLGVLLAIPLASCVTAAEREQAAMAADDAYCRSLGTTVGTKPYIDCRLMIKNNRMFDHTVAAAGNRGSVAGAVRTIVEGN